MIRASVRVGEHSVHTNALVAAWYRPRLTALTLVLTPLSLLFAAASAIRRALYAAGMIRTHRLRVPVIVVGNITAGGSGKTPLVEALATGQTGRFRICANDTCRWVFEDTSRAGRRRWCDMASCGNRAKVKAYRSRHKAHDADGDDVTAHAAHSAMSASTEADGVPI